MTKRITCDQCELLRINGVICHEHGCPKSGKRWEAGEWVRYRECHECGCDVREGEVCDCQNLEWEPDSEDEYEEVLCSPENMI